MEIINFKRKWICVFIIFSMLLQSCSVYRSKTVTLDEAVAKNSKMKVTKTDGSTIAFDKIEKTDSVYYGLIKTGEEHSRTPINEKDYVKIQPENKPISALATVGVVVIPFVAVLGLLQLIEVH